MAKVALLLYWADMSKRKYNKISDFDWKKRT
jgi:hypothetical protein